MKVDLNFNIKKLDGEDFVDMEPTGIDEKGQPTFKAPVPLTLRKACTDALTANFQDEQNLDPKKKAERGWLAMKIHNHPDPAIDLSVEDVALCKDLIGKRYNPLVVAIAWEILDPASKK